MADKFPGHRNILQFFCLILNIYIIMGLIVKSDLTRDTIVGYLLRNRFGFSSPFLICQTGIKVEGILRQSADVEEVDRRVQEYEQGLFIHSSQHVNENHLFCFVFFFADFVVALSFALVVRSPPIA